LPYGVARIAMKLAWLTCSNPLYCVNRGDM
jgi:hypothetical protein